MKTHRSLQDLVSYRVQTRDPFVIEMVGRATGKSASYFRIGELGLTLNFFFSGAECGATQVDRAFFRWLETVVESSDIYAGELGTGGHYVIKPWGRAMFRQFEIIKHTFDGTTDGSITLPRRMRTRDTNEARERIRQGILKITS